MEILMVLLWLLPISLLGFKVARFRPGSGIEREGATSGCAAMFAAGAFVLIPQGITIAIFSSNPLGASIAGAIVGVIAALFTVWFITEG